MLQFVMLKIPRRFMLPTIRAKAANSVSRDVDVLKKNLVLFSDKFYIK